jgi:hypothetical protein
MGAVAAPAIFDVIAARQVPDGRLLAGGIFGEALRRFHLVSYGCGTVIILALATRAILGPRPRHFASRTVIAVLMLGASLYSGLVLSERIARVQLEIGAEVSASSLPDSDLRRRAFRRLHGQSTALQLIPLLGGFVLLFLELRE